MAVRLYFRRFADQGHIDLGDFRAALPRKAGGVVEEEVRGRTLPLGIGRRKVVANIAEAQRAQHGVGQGM